jgi:hypothetical protein
MPDAENTGCSKLETLLRDLGGVVAILGGAAYLIDNGAAILLLRMVVQVSFVTQRPPAPSNPQIAPVIFIFTLALIYHAFGLPSNTSDLHRYEYSHGSLLVDFVGERGPVSRLRSIFVDCLILSIQLTMLAITFEHGKLQNRKGGSGQDVEAEEQGTRRSQDGQIVELQNMNQGTGGESGLAPGSHGSDHFYMDHKVLDVDIWKSLRELARSTTASSAIDSENGAVGSALGSVMARLVHQP